MNGKLELLNTLVQEGMHSAAAFNLDRLEELVAQQETLLRGLPRARQRGDNSEDAVMLARLRRSSALYSRVLMGTSRTMAALFAARQTAGPEESLSH